jgi:hypothetical protein
MKIIKSFAQDRNTLDERMDQLVEVLAQLLDEAAGATPITDLRSVGGRGTHVVGEPTK